MTERIDVFGRVSSGFENQTQTGRRLSAYFPDTPVALNSVCGWPKSAVGSTRVNSLVSHVSSVLFRWYCREKLAFSVTLSLVIRRRTLLWKGLPRLDLLRGTKDVCVVFCRYPLICRQTYIHEFLFAICRSTYNERVFRLPPSATFEIASTRPCPPWLCSKSHPCGTSS